VVRWPADGIDAALTAIVVTLIGPVVGLLWAAVAPKLSVAGLVRGSEAPFRAQIGADAWFLLLAVLAGAACGLVAGLLRRHGPGVVLGLGLGGVAASFVADRVGYLADRPDALTKLHAVGVTLAGLRHANIDPFLRVRGLGVALAWSMAAVVVHAIVVAASKPRSLP
jgi:hypothetical protein